MDNTVPISFLEQFPETSVLLHYWNKAIDFDGRLRYALLPTYPTYQCYNHNYTKIKLTPYLDVYDLYIYKNKLIPLTDYGMQQLEVFQHALKVYSYMCEFHVQNIPIIPTFKIKIPTNEMFESRQFWTYYLNDDIDWNQWLLDVETYSPKHLEDYYVKIT